MSQIHFKGKSFVYNHHLSVPHRPLQMDDKKSATGKGKARLDDNLIIQGDNLHALKALLPMYSGKINCIYIDPPYNTGEEKWCYNDSVNSPQIQSWMRDNPITIEDDLRHDKWCAMMWPRLKLLHELLADDGVIFISIDDNEHHRLRMIMDEIFGDDLFVGVIAWESKTKNQNTKDSYDMLQPKVEYILCYSKQKKVRFNLVQSGEKAYPEKDKNGVFRYAEVGQMSHEGTRSRASLVFPILKILPRKGNQWKVGQDTVTKFEERGDLVEKDGKPYFKMRPSDERTEKTDPFWAFFSKEIGTAETAKKELSAILGNEHGLETVKPMDMVKRLIFHASKSGDIILDSFAGSGTTAHATLALNKEDGGNRKFILVECEDYANRITAERVRRVIKGVPSAKDPLLKKGLGGAFTYCTLGDSIQAEKLLQGKDLPSYKELATLLFHTATMESIVPSKIDEKSCYIGESKRYHVWLIYKKDHEFLYSSDGGMTLEFAKGIVKKKGSKKPHLVFSPFKFVSDDVLCYADNGKALPVHHQPLPWPLYRAETQTKE